MAPSVPSISRLSGDRKLYLPSWDRRGPVSEDRMGNLKGAGGPWQGGKEWGRGREGPPAEIEWRLPGEKNVVRSRACRLLAED